MRPLSESRLFAWLCIILLAGILAGISTAAWAGGDEIKQITNVESDISNTLIGGENVAQGGSVSGGRSYAVGMGSIDVDIAGCLGSESTGIVVIQWQRLKENPWCQAIYLDQIGAYEAAAITRCSLKEYSQLFESNQDCVALSTAKPQEFPGEHRVAVPQNNQYNSLNEKYLLQMWESAAFWSEDVHDLSRHVHEAMAKAQSDVAGTEDERQLSELRRNLSSEGQADEGRLRELWFAGLRNASPRLLKAIGRGMAVPPMSFGSSQAREDHDEDIDALYAALTTLEQKLENETAELKKARTRPQVQRQVVQQPYLSDEQRKALLEVVK